MLNTSEKGNFEHKCPHKQNLIREIHVPNLLSLTSQIKPYYNGMYLHLTIGVLIQLCKTWMTGK